MRKIQSKGNMSIEASGLGEEIQACGERLKTILRGYGSIVVAFSGGVDSALLAFVAHEVLGERMLAVIAASPSLPGSEEKDAIAFLETHGIPYERIVTHEVDNESYRKNNPDRCYHCKKELFTALWGLAARRGFSFLAYGENADDGNDYRPGAAAAQEKRVVAPLSEASLDKRTVRALARSLGLGVWDKPSSPCLASRIPYYQHVTEEKLGQIEGAERVLKEAGFGVCRVRHHGEIGRIEIPLEDHPRLLERKTWERVVRGLRGVGFRYVTLDLEGFRSGGLNQAIRQERMEDGQG